MKIFALLLTLLSFKLNAAECLQDKLDSLYGTKDLSKLILNCSTKMKLKSVINFPIWFEGKEGSDNVLDCNYSTLKEGLRIRSKRVINNGVVVWERPENIQIKNCHIIGGVRVSGMKEIGVIIHKDLLKSSRFLGHTERAQAAAPKNISIINSTIESAGTVAAYIDPGVTQFHLENSLINGFSEKEAIYLDAESANNIIKNNTFKLSTGRPVISVDTSARNVIEGNQFVGKRDGGGIFIFRNCGELGLVRHQPPTGNIIKNNFFAEDKSQLLPDIHIGSRNKSLDSESFCWQDKNLENIPNIEASFDTRFKDLDLNLQKLILEAPSYGVGSSKINSDMAKDNFIIGNTMFRPIKYSNSQNELKDNISPIELNCSVNSSDLGCVKKFQCPEGKKISKLKVACNLETNYISEILFNKIEYNNVSILKHSFDELSGSCEVNQIKINSGLASLQDVVGSNSLRLKCQETEKGGGDCSVKAFVICE